MADGFQYIKLPDGSYGKFKSDATDDEIKTAVSRDFPNAYKENAASSSPSFTSDPIGAAGSYVNTAIQKIPVIGNAMKSLKGYVDSNPEAGIIPRMISSTNDALKNVGLDKAANFMTHGISTALMAGGAAGAPKDPLVDSIQNAPVSSQPPLTFGRRTNVIAPEPELGTPENPGWIVPLTDRMPKAAPEIDPLVQAVREGRAARLPVRMPKAQPELPQSLSPIPSAKLPGVIVAPEPRPLMPGENPGTMYSVPRSRLLGMARSGKPGAVDVLRDLGTPTVLVPREGIGYPGPRISAPLSQEEFEEALRPSARNAAD